MVIAVMTASLVPAFSGRSNGDEEIEGELVWERPASTLRCVAIKLKAAPVMTVWNSRSQSITGS